MYWCYTVIVWDVGDNLTLCALWKGLYCTQIYIRTTFAHCSTSEIVSVTLDFNSTMAKLTETSILLHFSHYKKLYLIQNIFLSSCCIPNSLTYPVSSTMPCRHTGSCSVAPHTMNTSCTKWTWAVSYMPLLSLHRKDTHNISSHCPGDSRIKGCQEIWWNSNKTILTTLVLNSSHVIQIHFLYNVSKNISTITLCLSRDIYHWQSILIFPKCPHFEALQHSKKHLLWTPHHTMFALAAVPLIITLETKLTMAEAGCSGSSSAKMWHWLSVLLAGFLATNPKQRLK